MSLLFVATLDYMRKHLNQVRLLLLLLLFNLWQYKKTVLAIIVIWLFSIQLIGTYYTFYYATIRLEKPYVIYVVKPGYSLTKVVHELTEQNIIKHPRVFYWTAVLKNTANKLKAGEYRIEDGQTLAKLLTQLVQGEVVQHAFTIVEGITYAELLQQLQANEFLQHTIENTEENLSILAHGFAKEGAFLPDTYYFVAGSKDTTVLAMAHRAMLEYLQVNWQADGPYISKQEALTAASIIEKETSLDEERALIAGVILRRLNLGMRLQMDSTVIYGLREQGYKFKVLSKELLKVDTPYNTYTRKGLPATPIAMPSRSSIYAAMHPNSSASLYFFAKKNEPGHYFSDTFEEHVKLVRGQKVKKL